MNLDEAFSKWYATQDHSGLPWQTSRDELFNVFYAGWHAHIEAIKQTDLFPGTWDKDPISADVAQPVERPPCKREVVDSNSIAGSISAEDIYAAYPRKVGKQAAIKAIEKAIKSLMSEGAYALIKGYPEVPRKFLLEKTKAYAAAVNQWPAADKQFIPHPATWFNRGSYDDDPKEWQRGTATTSQFSKTH